MSILSTNADEVYLEVVGRVQAVVPGFVPRGFTEQIFRVFATAAAEINGNVDQRVADEARLSQGDVLGIPIQDGVPATSTITIQAVDSIGHTLPEGTRVWVGGSPGSAIECETTTELVIAAADDDGTVGIQTVKATAEYNGATGDISMDPLDWIDDYVLNDPLDDGVDPETIAEYDVRLIDETQLRGVAISLPADAATLARSHTGVGWAYCIDHYDVDTDTSDLPLTFSTIVAAADGTAVDSDVLTEVDESIDARLATNFVSKVANATYTPVSVTAEVVVMDDWDEATVLANATQAITDAVSPDRHLTPPYTMTANYQPPRRIYTSDLIAACKAADGVLYVIPGTFDIVGVGDYLELASPAHLPEAGTITVTAA